MADTLNAVATEVGLALSPLSSALSSAQNAEALLKRLGFMLPTGVADIGLAGLSMQKLIDNIQTVINSTPEELDNIAVMGPRIAELVAEIANVVDLIRKLMTNLPAILAGAGDYVVLTRIDQELLTRLLDLLVVNYTYRRSPMLFASMQMLTLFELRHFDSDPTNFQTDHVRAIIHYDRIETLLSNPPELFVKGYGWGTDNFNAQLLLSNFAALLQGIGGFAQLRQLSRKVEEALSGRAVPEAATDPAAILNINLIKELGRDGGAEVGLSIYEVRASATGATDGGIGFMPIVRGTTQVTLPLYSDELFFELDAGFDLGTGVNLMIRAGQSPVLQAGLFNGTSTTQARLGLGLRYGSEQGGSKTLIAFPGGSRVEVRQIALKGGGELQASRDFDPFIEFKLSGLQFLLTLSGADSFVNQSMSSSSDITIDFDLLMRWSKAQGLCFEGSGALEVHLPTHISIGPIELLGLTIAVRPENNKVPLDMATSIKVSLGPLQAVVEEMGVRVAFSFPDDQQGNLGPLDVVLGFKPPAGVGISINTGIVKGGGYLNFNFDKEEYSGSFELTIKNIINLGAIGLITTRMPDGTPGFSLLIIITAEFTPIQLGFGFTLSGVGGLLGLNRTMLEQMLVEGVRSGAINSVMFPTDVVANAPRIISDLQSFFPVHEGIFLIGPMAKLGWGTPNLVTLSLCIIIEIPGNIVILGVLKASLPDETAEILRLQVSFFGSIEFDKKRVYFYAVLFDSRILTMTIEGDMGVLVAWGDDANFVISVGGFHPAFTAPSLPFPELRRIAISILNNKYARIRVESYFAITSNTVQFGANVELFFGSDAFKAEGNLTFDALFQFSPFYFIITISASLSVQALGIPFFGVYFQGSLEGPTPWRIAGTGTVVIAGLTFPIPFNETWGEEVKTTLPPIKVVPLVVAEFEKLENWKAELPASKRIFVSLRKIEDTNDLSETSEKLQALPTGVVFPDDLKDKIRYYAAQQLLIIKGVMSREEKNALLRLSTDVLYEKAIEALFQKSQFIVLHPVGTLKISQRAIPLELQLDKVGNQKPEDADYFTVTVSTPGFVKKGDLDESFAMGQFKDMDDANKLSSPAFEKWKAGIELSAGDVQTKTSLAVKRVVRYEKIIIDTHYKRAVEPLFVLFSNLFTLFLGGNAVTKSTLSQQYLIQKQPFADKVAIQSNLWVVASNADNSALAGTAGTFTSQAKAHEYMQQQVKERPDLAENIHVIPKTEVRRAAA